MEQINNKTWDRGKKRLTPTERVEAQKWQKTRVGIINLIARHPEIEKICCICGKEGKTLHNRENPYFITFICDKCRKNKDNLLIAEKSRKDIRKRLNDVSVINFNNDKIIKLVEQFMNSELTLGEFCEQECISRYQFNKVIERYADNNRDNIIEIYKILTEVNRVKEKCFRRKYKNIFLVYKIIMRYDRYGR